MVEISIVIPSYNEEIRLNKSLKKIVSFCKNNFNSYEIIVIDDGSLDKTREIAKKYDCKLNKKRKNMGKGYSVKEGVSIAKGDIILITDSDLSTPINEFHKLNKYLGKFDIVIGSRALRDSNVKTRFYKKLLGRISNLILKIIIGDIKDSQCGFKLFKKDIAKKLFKLSRINRWGFDFEILFLAKKFNFKVKEVGVKWVEDTASKVRLMDYPNTLVELFKLIYFNIIGKYK